MWFRFWAKIFRVPEKEFSSLWKVFWKETLGSFRWSSGYQPEDGRKLWWISLGLFALFGLFPLSVLRISYSYFNAFFLGFTLLMFLILFLLVTNFPSLLFSEKDASQLAHCPVHSASIFSVKFLLLLVFTLPWAISYSIPIGVALVILGFSNEPGNFFLSAGFFLGAIFLVLFLSSSFFLSYLWLLERWGGEKLALILDILQWVFAILLFSMLLLSRGIFGMTSPEVFRQFGKMHGILLLPSAWFSGFSSLFLWHWQGERIWIFASLFSVLLTFFCIRVLFSRFREVFFERVVESLFTPTKKIRKARFLHPPSALFRKPMERAIFLLLSAYSFRDPKLRSTLIFFGLGGIFLMIFLFFLVALPAGLNPVDIPMYSATRNLERAAYYLSLLFIFYFFTLLFLRFQTSDHWRASWVLYVFGGNPAELFRSSIKTLVFFLSPFLLAFYLVYFIRLGFTLRMVFELIFTFFLLVLCGEILLLWKPAFIFSQPTERVRMSSTDILILYLLPGGIFVLDLLFIQLMGFKWNVFYHLLIFVVGSVLLLGIIRLLYPLCEKRLYWVSQEVEV